MPIACWTVAASLTREKRAPVVTRVAATLSVIGLIVGHVSGARAEPATGEGAFASAEVQATRVNEGFGAVLGLHAGWETRAGYRLGGSFYDLLNGTPLPEQGSSPRTLRTKMHYGGALLGKNFPIGPVGLGCDVLLGVGDVSSYTGAKNQDSGASLYLVAYPALTFRPPDLRHFRTQLAAGYRFTIPVRDGGTDSAPLGGPAVSLTIGVARLWGRSSSR